MNKDERSLVVKEKFGISVSDPLDKQMELCLRWGRSLQTLNTKKFVRRGKGWALVPRAKEIDIFAVLNGETKYPAKDTVSGMPSQIMFRSRGDKGYHDEYKIEFQNPCSVEAGEIEGW